MELRRYKEILAVKEAAHLPAVAFHGLNLELAEISEETWAAMATKTSEAKELVHPTPLALEAEALEALEEWNAENNSPQKTLSTSFEIDHLTLNVTQICNLKCTYCAAGGDGTYGEAINKVNIEKTLPQMKYFIEKLKSGRKFKVSFVGGEPLLYPEAVRLIGEYIRKESSQRGVLAELSIVTNGTLLNDEIIKILTSIEARVTLSLDGPAKINDHVRAGKSTHINTALIVQNLEKLIRVKSDLASLGLSAVFSAEHARWPEALIEAYQFFSNFDVDWYDFHFANEEKDVKVHESYMQQMTVIAQKAWQKGQENELRKIRSFDFYFDLLDRQQRLENYCGAGKNYVAIDAKNQIYPCVWSAGKASEKIGSDRQIDSTKILDLQKPLIELNNCQTCWAKHLCGGGCMAINEAHTGFKHKKSDLFCKRTRHLISLALLYYHRARAGGIYENKNPY